MAATLGDRMCAMCPVGKRVKAWLDSIRTTVDGTRTLAVELRADHATFKAAVDEIHTWAETLAAKLNADAGVTDTDYDAVITNDAPAALTAGDPAAAPATLDTYE